MTINYNRDWYRSPDVYYKQNVRTTATMRSPHSAIGAIDHFSKPRVLRRYSEPLGYLNNGVANKGEYETIEFWCFIRPPWASRKNESYDVSEIQGVRTEGLLAVYYDPYHENHPPEGIHLHLSNARSIETMDYSGFADVVEYKGLLWKVITHDTFDTAYDDGVEYMGKATMERYKDDTVKEVDFDQSTTQNYYRVK